MTLNELSGAGGALPHRPTAAEATAQLILDNVADLGLERALGQVLPARVAFLMGNKAVLEINKRFVLAESQLPMSSGDQLLVRVRGYDGQRAVLSVVDQKERPAGAPTARQDLETLLTRFGLSGTPQEKALATATLEYGFGLDENTFKAMLAASNDGNVTPQQLQALMFARANGIPISEATRSGVEVFLAGQSRLGPSLQQAARVLTELAMALQELAPAAVAAGKSGSETQNTTTVEGLAKNATPAAPPAETGGIKVPGTMPPPTPDEPAAPAIKAPGTAIPPTGAEPAAPEAVATGGASPPLAAAAAAPIKEPGILIPPAPGEPAIKVPGTLMATPAATPHAAAAAEAASMGDPLPSPPGAAPAAIPPAPAGTPLPPPAAISPNVFGLALSLRAAVTTGQAGPGFTGAQQFLDLLRSLPDDLTSFVVGPETSAATVQRAIQAVTHATESVALRGGRAAEAAPENREALEALFSSNRSSEEIIETLLAPTSEAPAGEATTAAAAPPTSRHSDPLLELARLRDGLQFLADDPSFTGRDNPAFRALFDAAQTASGLLDTQRLMNAAMVQKDERGAVFMAVPFALPGNPMPQPSEVRIYPPPQRKPGRRARLEDLKVSFYLDAQAMGRMKIDMAWQGGAVHFHFLVSRPEVRDFLAGRTDTLSRRLEQHQVKVGRVNLAVGEVPGLRRTVEKQAQMSQIPKLGKLDLRA